MDIYTDGSCLGNPGPGGFGVVCVQDDKVIATYHGNVKHTTNNRMELQAAITALEKRKSRGNKIHTDSKYVKQGIEEWIKIWKQTNWKNGKIKNIDLWQLLDILNKKYKPEWNWVKAHNGNQWNEHADHLAKESAKKVKVKKKVKKKVEFQLNEKQQQALEYILQGKNIFITGGGGTGKTEFIKYYIKHYKSKTTAVTSTTGTSAILIGGTTMYSYLGIGLGKGTMRDLAQKVRKKKYLRDRWINLQILIIDEISMLSAELFDKLEQVARIVRKNDKPFGGVQLILAGDFCQLPCIDSQNFCFEAQSWKNTINHIIYLTEILRQSNPIFCKVLSKLRLGKKTGKVKKLINSRIGANLTNSFGIMPTKLFSHNTYVDELNKKAITTLASQNGTEILEYERIEYLKKNRKIKHFQAPKLLQLTKNCQVMLIHNLDIPNKLVNGSRGIVTDFIDDKPVVRFMNGQKRLIEYHIWELEENNMKLGTVEQLPLKPGYAFSIHKSQGATLDLVQVDLEEVFQPGMGYVALSRVKDLESLSITGINWSRINAHPKATKFYKNL